MSQEGLLKGLPRLLLYHRRFKIDMCTCDTFLCTYYLRRPQSVNIDCGMVAFADMFFQQIGLGNGRGTFPHALQLQHPM